MRRFWPETDAYVNCRGRALTGNRKRPKKPQLKGFEEAKDNVIEVSVVVCRRSESGAP